MLQFSIRNLLFGTLFCAVGFAISTAFGFEYFLWLNLLFLHVSASCVLAIGSLEYSGYRKRFCIASLLVEIIFMIWIFMNYYDVVLFNVMSVIGFSASYLAGLMSAGAYRAIAMPQDPCDSWHPLDCATRVIARTLPDPKPNQDVGS